MSVGISNDYIRPINQSYLLDITYVICVEVCSFCRRCCTLEYELAFQTSLSTSFLNVGISTGFSDSSIKLTFTQI